MQIIRSEIFKKYPQINFGLSTSVGGVSPSPFNMNLSLATNDKKTNVLKNREIFFLELGIPPGKVNYQKQVHSSLSKNVTKSGFSGECDATYTNIKNVFLTVSVADCLPVFLFEPNKEVIAAIHAGWRGSADHIVEKTIAQLVKEFSINPSDTVAFLGPCISQEHFEVGEEVGDLFTDDVKIKKGNKFHIDLRKENISQLINSGLKKKNIEISPLCTYKESDLLHSYRRDREMSGRMFGVLGMVD